MDQKKKFKDLLTEKFAQHGDKIVDLESYRKEVKKLCLETHGKLRGRLHYMGINPGKLVHALQKAFDEVIGDPVRFDLPKGLFYLENTSTAEPAPRGYADAAMVDVLVTSSTLSKSHKHTLIKALEKTSSQAEKLKTGKIRACY